MLEGQAAVYPADVQRLFPDDRDLVARVDHAGAAQTAGLTLKALAWEDDKGQVWLAYNEPAWLAARHGVTDRGDGIRA